MGTPDGGDRLGNGRYRLIEVIGRGGMGTVWHGHDEMLDREVAIKEITLPPDLDDDARAELGALAMREARATARLSHPGIITIFDVIEDDGVPIIVMELLHGDSLDGILKEQVRLPYRRVAEIGAAMLEALREAHAAGVVHRDLKPANVLISARRIVLTDFGVAQRVGEHPDEPGDVTGTPAFMAPEQAENAAASPAADLWALGATLFNAVEGRPPYQGPDYVTVLLTLLTQDPPAPVRAGPLAPVITALLRKDPERRPSAEQVASQLAEILREDDGGTVSRALSAGSPPVRPSTPPAATPPPRPKATSPTRPPSRIVPLTLGNGQPAPRPKPGVSPAGSPYLRPRTPSRLNGDGRLGITIAAVIVLGLGALFFAGHISSSSGVSNPYDPPDGFPMLPSSPSTTPSSVPDTSEPPPSKVFQATAFSPDGKTVAFGGDSGVVRLYDTATQKPRRSLKVSRDGEVIRVLDFSPDGRSIAAELDGGVVDVWDLGTRKEPEVLDLEDVGDAMRFSSDGRTLTALGAGGHVASWNLRTGKRTSSVIPLPTGALCIHLAVSPNGHDVACGYYNGGDANDDNGALVVGDARRGDQAAAWPGAGPRDGLMFSPNGRTLAFSGSDGRLELWDVASRRRTGGLNTTGIGNAPAFSPDGRTLAELSFDAGPHQDVIGVWKIPGGRRVAAVPVPDGVHALALGPGAGMLAVATDGGGVLWSVKSHKKLASWTG
jgi:serine/threonine protein kinase